MKKLLTLSLICCLTMMAAGGALAAVHNFTGDFTNPYLMPSFSSQLSSTSSFDNWYYIEKDTPSATIRASYPTSSFTRYYGLEYFDNDQSFVNLTYNDYTNYWWGESDPDTFIKGSYLFKNNFFIGIDYGSFFDGAEQETFSPGYRYNLGENAYIAASLDYAKNDKYNKDYYDYSYADKGIVDYEITGRYYTNKSRIYGQLIKPNDDVVGTDKLYVNLGGAYQVAPKVVLGALYTREEGESAYEVGVTTSVKTAEIDFKYANDADHNYTMDLNLLNTYSKKVKAGLELIRVEGETDPVIAAKCKYTINDSKSFIFEHQLSNPAFYDANKSVNYFCLNYQF